MLQVGLAPHVYPFSITTAPPILEKDADVIRWKWDLSWGWKFLGLDRLSDVSNNCNVMIFTFTFE
jgi:hypothetical protein